MKGIHKRQVVCINKLKEEIIAKTTYYPIGMHIVKPVRNVSHIRYDRGNGGTGDGTFQEALERAQEGKGQSVAGARRQSEMERMAGLNQYDCHARELFYSLCSTTDYRC